MPVAATGRRRLYCSDACRQAACRRRRGSPVYFRSESDNWSTDPKLFAELDAKFHFTLDAAASAENAKCPRYFTQQEDGLTQPWTGRVWCNPPYGRTIGKWIAKAFASTQSGQAELVVLLIPAKPDTSWWHEWCVRGEIHFLRGRLRFGGAKSGAPFPSAWVVFRNANSVTKPALFRDADSVTKEDGREAG
jgi:phage N-6-adenine-methyltransferase